MCWGEVREVREVEAQETLRLSHDSLPVAGWCASGELRVGETSLADRFRSMIHCDQLTPTFKTFGNETQISGS